MMGLFSFFTEDGKGCSAVLNRSALVYEVIVIFFPIFESNQVIQFRNIYWICIHFATKNVPLIN